MRFLYIQARNFLELEEYRESSTGHDIIGYWHAPLGNSFSVNWTRKRFLWEHVLHLLKRSYCEHIVVRSLNTIISFLTLHRTLTIGWLFAVTLKEIFFFNKHALRIIYIIHSFLRNISLVTISIEEHSISRYYRY